jgi:hypothetical protein|tara:strand:+ start:286 stop:507 length:222 start_codon:yes stop_codon:yes gene_type:complete
MDNQEKVYHDLFDHALHLLNDHSIPVELVAGTMMAIGQRLYKTHLDDEEYERMIDFIIKTKVKPYKVEKLTIH